ncbi:MAG: hypothetical protein HQL36_05020 [Alphaproteobacteria bacterium]|nr:hypothetical protein [Alphaproteobacteria bacterium]MBF0249845.1 hypothetical protein [Alphaproteobacteria bacterium]
MKHPVVRIFAPILAAVALAGCQADSRQQILHMDKSQVALRSAQSRAFDTADTELTVRTIIATLQDLGFTVDKVDQTLGLVSATKAGNYVMKMTVTARPRGVDQIVVRASAQHNLTAVSDVAPYQQFFDSLAQSLFLEAHDVI